MFSDDQTSTRRSAWEFDNHEPESWKADGICAQVDPDLWYPEKGGSTKKAKKVCSNCPVREQCLNYAMDHNERFGIWGGYSERERRKLNRGIDITPTPSHGGHQPSHACYQRGCRHPECCEANAAAARAYRARKKTTAA